MKMVTQKQAEEAIVANYGEMEVEGKDLQNKSTDETSIKGSLKSFFWHGGSVYDAWFSCASNQVHRSIPPNLGKCHVVCWFLVCIASFFIELDRTVHVYRLYLCIFQTV